MKYLNLSDGQVQSAPHGNLFEQPFITFLNYLMYRLLSGAQIENKLHLLSKLSNVKELLLNCVKCTSIKRGDLPSSIEDLWIEMEEQKSPMKK